MVSLVVVVVGTNLKTADQNSFWIISFFSLVVCSGSGVYLRKEIKVLRNFFGYHLNNYFCQRILKQREKSQFESLL